MNLLIDGPSRSGKLLLAKTLLTSPNIAFQHYSGDLERILEALWFTVESQTTYYKILELMRINMVHTFEDLRQSRQLSLNANDSSYYKKSAFYDIHELKLNAGISANEIDSCARFIIHTHECVLFLNSLLKESGFLKLLSNQIRTYISVVRNPSAQIVSWINRDYTRFWNSKSMSISPFTQYPSQFNLRAAYDEGVDRFPWYIDQSLKYYIEHDYIDNKHVEKLLPDDLIAISVCYLTSHYLDLVESENSEAASREINNSVFRFVVFHESIHDSKCANIKNILDELGYRISPQRFNEVIKTELSPSRFGISSIADSLVQATDRISSQTIKNILNLQASRYESALIEYGEPKSTVLGQ